MNVLYDISVLGAGLKNETSRTGVFRVVESVAEELVKQAGVDVVFCGSTSMYQVSSAMEYLKQSHGFENIPFSKPVNFELKSEASLNRSRLNKLFNSDVSMSFAEKLIARIQMHGYSLKGKMIPPYNNLFVHPNDLKRADIYHSPFYPIPAEMASAGVKSMFLTCYDLIPIIHSQYSVEGVIQLIKEVLGSITPETWVLCISHATRSDLLNYLGKRIDPGRVLVTHLAASGKFYQSTDNEKNLSVRRKYNIPDQPYVLSLCTLEPRKNIESAIRAFVRVVKQENIRDLNLVLVGTKGWMFDKIFTEIESSNELKNRIIITGFIPDLDLAAIYTDALMFVYPTHYEGFGLPPLEAMSCGTPVITSNTSSLPEVVGDAGIIISATDLDALCEAMLNLYRNEAYRKQLSDKSLQRAKSFSWERCARETVDAYKLSLK